MKKSFVLLLAVLALFSLAGCGVSREAREVTALIEAIGEVTLESEPAIVAAEEGATMVRLGRALFGARPKMG